jgi:integrase
MTDNQVTRVELTDRMLKALRPGTETWSKYVDGKDRPILWDTVVPGGFGVRISGTRRSFVLVKRYPGSKNPTQRAIGACGAISLDKAREKARAWLELIQKGIDPADHEEEQRAAEQRRRADTFAATFESFVAHHLSTLRTGRDVEIIMRRALLPGWGGRPLTGITRRDVIAIVFGIHDGGSKIAANRTLAYIKKFFAWCVERGLLDASPASLVKNPARETSRDRTLSDVEIRAVWRACDRCGAAGRAIQFMLATGCRRAEAGGVVWSEIDFGDRLWRLPAHRVKNNRSHELPLSDVAIACFAEARGAFAFSTDGGTTPVNGWSKAKRRLDAAALEELQRERPGADFPEWHLHDLRRSVATNLARLGVDRVVIGKILNHTANGDVTAIYDRYGRDREITEAMAAWGLRLKQIVDGKPADVVSIRRGRRI